MILQLHQGQESRKIKNRTKYINFTVPSKQIIRLVFAHKHAIIFYNYITMGIINIFESINAIIFIVK